MSGKEARASRKPKKASGPLQTDFFRTGRTTFCGFAYDRENEQRKFTVALMVDGQIISTALSDEPVADLLEKGIGDGRFGFTFNVSVETVAASRIVEARLANLDTPVGFPIACDEVSPEGNPQRIGDLDWVGGLRFEGWLSTELDGEIEVLVAQQPVMTIRPTGWTHVSQGDGFGPARRIDFHLPEHFADGRVRLLSARMLSGRNILAEPIPFVAFDHGLEQALSSLGRWKSERLRGKLFDQLVPASIPFHAYDSWKVRFPSSTQSEVPSEAAVVFIGDIRVDESIDGLEAQTHSAWTAVSLPTKGTFSRIDPKSAVEFLNGDAAESDFFLFCLSGTILAEDALQRLAEVFAVEPDCDFVYGDVDIQSGAGVWPLALPAFDLERSLEQAYPAYFFAVRRDRAIDALRSANSLFGLFYRCIGKDASGAAVRHLPGALAALPQIDLALAAGELAEAAKSHLANTGVRASVEVRVAGLFPAVRVRREIKSSERTTIVIPTRNRVELLRRCIESIEPAARKARANVLIVDNDSTDPETLEYLDSVAARKGVDVISAEGPFNFAWINNAAVGYVDAENVCFLNNDIEALDDDWLSEMLSRLSDPSVGAVGAKLLWPNGVVQHGGVVLGTNFAATHAFNDRIDGDPGYGDLLQVAHECSAVTAACLLLRKRDYLAVDGMDEIRFPINFNDVDLCLKLRQRRQRIVFSPDAKLIHLESASRGRDQAPDRKARFNRELLMLRSKWGEALLNDPYYSPILGLDSTPFSALAWPPRSWQSRVNLPPNPTLPPIGL